MRQTINTDNADGDVMTLFGNALTMLQQQGEPENRLLFSPETTSAVRLCWNDALVSQSTPAPALLTGCGARQPPCCLQGWVAMGS